MKFTKRVIKIGGSLYIAIPKDVCELLTIEEDDSVEADIISVVTNEKEMIRIECLDCSVIFDTLKNLDIYDCPGCGAEILSIDAKIIE